MAQSTSWTADFCQLHRCCRGFGGLALDGQHCHLAKSWSRLPRKVGNFLMVPLMDVLWIAIALYIEQFNTIETYEKRFLNRGMAIGCPILLPLVDQKHLLSFPHAPNTSRPLINIYLFIYHGFLSYLFFSYPILFYLILSHRLSFYSILSYLFYFILPYLISYYILIFYSIVSFYLSIYLSNLI